MIVVIGMIISIAGLIGVFYSTRFERKEGKDERGDQITGNAAKISLFVFLLSYLSIFLIGNLYSLTSEQYKLANACLLAGVLCSYSLSILVLRKRY
ncbi:DUF2178 domain-containing protein [Bacillus pseudomycoides]|uniref:DUF2178 domain-containing protein n=1 Tax=Bacillus pseudomycoides TaxID=64104 RepID=UPI000BEC88F0|nr:DUF2178 domain-containing protein [Bacillus pseudomycoides]PDX99261.1 DUF2178 domain-containing protein [Bacillus pseudomycoides]PEK73701.1 DUF2178 domain-containing protein [Bacillus pseudomycoides]PEN08080.1 DUF2178 domain-containing protein [Bacillus pseudomycoides]PGB87577.1 DUF2178 domain-containing protein [Bacillus pseudomycoides]PHE58067.1 DUF2178 domain-containing protein [Bacillus pseudomycoides]